MQQINHEIKRAKNTLAAYGVVRESKKWQGIEKGFSMYEINNFTLEALIPSNINVLQFQCQPNLPWADDHFAERVGGKPLNPGNEYKNWPFYPRGNDSQIRNEVFTHSYMERFWPKHANRDREDGGAWNFGIRYHYGDLEDVIDLLQREPDTRQAYLPIWFPEDTGVNHGGRVPCTLGYLFNMRDGQLHITYYIRSCDFIRHFQDDIYMACKLVYWILYKLQFNTKAINDNSWNNITPGTITMHIANLHVFATEASLIKKP